MPKINRPSDPAAAKKQLLDSIERGELTIAEAALKTQPNQTSR